MSETDICKNCRYYEPVLQRQDDPTITEGDCHRFPPVAIWDNNAAHRKTFWPNVAHDAWCGEFQGIVQPNPFAVEAPR